MQYSFQVSLHCKGLLSLLSGKQIPQELPLIKTPQDPGLHPMEDPVSVHMLFSLSSALPFLAETSFLAKSFRIHTFCLSQTAAKSPQQVSWKQFNNTVGFGCIGKLWDVGRLELNYCVPLGEAQGRPGLRFSFGAEFL